LWFVVKNGKGDFGKGGLGVLGKIGLMLKKNLAATAAIEATPIRVIGFNSCNSSFLNP